MLIQLTAEGIMSTFCSWRLDNVVYRRSQLELIAQCSPDVLALQNVSPSYYSALKSSEYFAYSCYQRCSTGRGHAIFSQYPLGDYYISIPTLRDYPLVRYVALPAGMITILVFSDDNPSGIDLTVVNQLSGPVIAAVAAVETSFDMKSFRFPCHGEGGAQTLLMGSKCEGLADVFRRYVCANPALKKAIQSLRPRGPIALASLGRANRRTTSEFILANDRFLTYHCHYSLQEACSAGVHNALISAELVVDHPNLHPFKSRYALELSG
jgi:hypothetical protein